MDYSEFRFTIPEGLYEEYANFQDFLFALDIIHDFAFYRRIGKNDTKTTEVKDESEEVRKLQGLDPVALVDLFSYRERKIFTVLTYSIPLRFYSEKSEGYINGIYNALLDGSSPRGDYRTKYGAGATVEEFQRRINFLPPALVSGYNRVKEYFLQDYIAIGLMSNLIGKKDLNRIVGSLPVEYQAKCSPLDVVYLIDALLNNRNERDAASLLKVAIEGMTFLLNDQKRKYVVLKFKAFADRPEMWVDALLELRTLFAFEWYTRAVFSVMEGDRPQHSAVSSHRIDPTSFDIKLSDSYVLSLKESIEIQCRICALLSGLQEVPQPDIPDVSIGMVDLWKSVTKENLALLTYTNSLITYIDIGPRASARIGALYPGENRRQTTKKKYEFDKFIQFTVYLSLGCCDNMVKIAKYAEEIGSANFYIQMGKFFLGRTGMVLEGKYTAKKEHYDHLMSLNFESLVFSDDEIVDIAPGTVRTKSGATHPLFFDLNDALCNSGVTHYNAPTSYVSKRLCGDDYMPKSACRLTQFYDAQSLCSGRPDKSTSCENNFFLIEKDDGQTYLQAKLQISADEVNMTYFSDIFGIKTTDQLSINPANNKSSASSVAVNLSNFNRKTLGDFLQVLDAFNCGSLYLTYDSFSTITTIPLYLMLEKASLYVPYYYSKDVHEKWIFFSPGSYLGEVHRVCTSTVLGSLSGIQGITWNLMEGYVRLNPNEVAGGVFDNWMMYYNNLPVSEAMVVGYKNVVMRRVQQIDSAEGLNVIYLWISLRLKYKLFLLDKHIDYFLRLHPNGAMSSLLSGVDAQVDLIFPLKQLKRVDEGAPWIVNLSLAKTFGGNFIEKRFFVMPQNAAHLSNRMNNFNALYPFLETVFERGSTVDELEVIEEGVDEVTVAREAANSSVAVVEESKGKKRQGSFREDARAIRRKN